MQAPLGGLPARLGRTCPPSAADSLLRATVRSSSPTGYTRRTRAPHFEQTSALPPANPTNGCLASGSGTLEAVGHPLLFGNQAMLDGQPACRTPRVRVGVRNLNGIPFGSRALDPLGPLGPLAADAQRRLETLPVAPRPTGSSDRVPPATERAMTLRRTGRERFHCPSATSRSDRSPSESAGDPESR